MENLNEEIWREIKGYEGSYQVSNLGRIKSLERYRRGNKGALTQVKERIIKNLMWGNTYYSCHLYNSKGVKQHLIHRLVAFAFPEICGDWFEGAVCNHKNEIMTDNRAENLEWVTNKYNVTYGNALRCHEARKIPICQYDKDGICLCYWFSSTDAFNETSIRNISLCLTGKRKSAGGYIWKYAKEGD